jgi:hypothetical protein
MAGESRACPIMKRRKMDTQIKGKPVADLPRLSRRRANLSRVDPHWHRIDGIRVGTGALRDFRG